MTIADFTELFKWITIIGVGFLFLSTMLVIALKQTICKAHARLFGVKEEYVPVIAYGYLALFKALIILFAIVPYIALMQL